MPIFSRRSFAIAIIACACLLSACGQKQIVLESVAVNRLPRAWPQAHDITCDCGAYQAQAVLASYGKSIAIPKLYVSDWDRSQCSTLPWHFAAIFEMFGQYHIRSHYDFTDTRFLEIVQRALKRNHPLIVLIQATRGHHGLHWISIWGFDAKQQAFFVYDSQYPSQHGGIGNSRYSVKMLEDRFPWWTRIAIEAGR